MLIPLPRRIAFTLCGLACLLLLMPGCGKKAASRHKDGGEVTDQGASGKHKKSSGKVTKKTKPKVWENDPLAIAANRAPIGGGGGGGGGGGNAAPSAPKDTPAQAAPAANKPPDKPAASSGGGDDWKSVISNDTIVDETKKIKARLTDALQNVGKYNGNYKDGISVDGAVMAALAGIVIANPDVSVSWKGDAAHVRDLGGEVSKKAKGLGQASYDPTKQAWDKLEALLSGNKPPGLEDAAPVIPFSEVAGRGPLMKRMEKAFQWMKSNIGTDELMKKNAETITNEASMLAALAKVVASVGYNSADEAEYQGYVKEMIKANMDVLAAIKNEDFKAFTEANSRSQKACNDCHQDYRFAN